MFWAKPLQVKVKNIGILSLAKATVLVILVQTLLLFCTSSNSEQVAKYENGTKSKPDMNCNIEFDHKHQLPFSYISSIVTVFLVIFDIPSSVALLIGTSRKLSNNIVPWLFINGIKMIISIVAICVIVWGAYINIAGGIQFFHGSKRYLIGEKTTQPNPLR